jgi:hypothetical protein
MLLKLKINLDKIDQSKIKVNKNNQRTVDLLINEVPKPTKEQGFSCYHVKTKEEVAKKTKYQYVGSAVNLKEQIQRGSPDEFFMVFVEGGNSPTNKHDNFQSAYMEARRLSKELDKTAIVLRSSTPVLGSEDKAKLREKSNEANNKPLRTMQESFDMTALPVFGNPAVASYTAPVSNRNASAKKEPRQRKPIIVERAERVEVNKNKKIV